MKKVSKFLALAMAAALIVALAACGGGGSTNTTTTATGNAVANGTTALPPGESVVTLANGQTSIVSVTTVKGATTQKQNGATTKQNTKATTQMPSVPTMRNITTNTSQKPSPAFMAKLKTVFKNNTMTIVSPWAGATPGTPGFVSSQDNKKNFEKVTGVTLNDTYILDYKKSVVSAMMAGNPPGHMLMVQDMDFLNWFKTGFFGNVDTPDVKSQAKVSVNDPVTMPACYQTANKSLNIDGKQVSYVAAEIYCPTIWYDKTAVGKLGLGDPFTLYKNGQWTMAKLKQFAQKVQQNPTTAGFVASDWGKLGTAFVHTTGGSLIGYQNGVPVPSFSTANQSGADLLGQWVQNKLVAISSPGWDACYTDFWAGKYKMILCTNYVYTKAPSTSVVTTYGTVPFPKGSNSKDNLYAYAQFTNWVPAKYQSIMPYIMYCVSIKDRFSVNIGKSWTDMTFAGFKQSNSANYEWYYKVTGDHSIATIYNTLDITENNIGNGYPVGSNTWNKLFSQVGSGAQTAAQAFSSLKGPITNAYSNAWGQHKVTSKM